MDIFSFAALVAILVIVIVVAARIGALERQLQDLKRTLHALASDLLYTPPASARVQPPPSQQEYGQHQQQAAQFQQPAKAQFQPPTTPAQFQPPTAPAQFQPPTAAQLHQPAAAQFQPPTTPVQFQPPTAAQFQPPAASQIQQPPLSVKSSAAFPDFPPSRPLPSQVSSPSGRSDSTQATPKRSFEALFGKNIVGIVASILVFIGLIFLGFLVVPLLNDAVKIVLMFTISAAISACGYLFNRRYSNNFTKTLLGTGCGTFFIAIQMTHLYFNAINDIVAFLLLLAWIAASLFIARQSDSLLVGIIAHVGMIFSVCAGYLIGLSDDKLLLLMGYQFISTVLIVAGNMLCCRKLYRFGLFATLALTVYASRVMWTFFTASNSAYFASDLPIALIAAAFIIQFIGSSFLAYLLFVSIVRVKSTTGKVLLQIPNLILWQLSLFINIGALISRLVEISMVSSEQGLTDIYQSFPPALAVMTLLMYVVAILIIFLYKSLKFDVALEKTTVLFLIITSCLMMLYNLSLHEMAKAGGPNLTLLLIPALLAIGAKLLSSSRIYSYTALGILAVDAVLMCLFGYWELTKFGTMALSGAYLVVLLGLGCAAYRLLDQGMRDRQQKPFIVISTIVFEVSVATILLSDYQNFSIALIGLLSVGALLALHFLKLDSPRAFFRTNEYLLYFFISLEFALDHPWSEPVTKVIHVLAVICALVLILDRIRLAALSQSLASRTPGARLQNTDIEALSALALHCLLLGTLHGLTGWLDQPYALSLASMIIALAIIALGFWSRIRSLRLYGLVIVILCVLKLVLFDLGGLNTVMRVVAFIGGGIICFGISALYNFAVKRCYADQPTQHREQPTQHREQPAQHREQPPGQY